MTWKTTEESINGHVQLTCCYIIIHCARVCKAICNPLLDYRFAEGCLFDLKDAGKFENDQGWWVEIVACYCNILQPDNMPFSRSNVVKN
jgi:hypothetical protein